MSYRLIDANALNNKISTEDYEIIMKEPEVFADLPNGLDGGFHIAVPAHEGMTNGDMIKALYPGNVFDEEDEMTVTMLIKGFKSDLRNCVFNKDWWNAPYKGMEG